MIKHIAYNGFLNPARIWEYRFNSLPKSPAMFLSKTTGFTLPFYSS